MKLAARNGKISTFIINKYEFTTIRLTLTAVNLQTWEPDKN